MGHGERISRWREEGKLVSSTTIRFRSLDRALALVFDLDIRMRHNCTALIGHNTG
ncbi:MAG TPA: hypothetical protein VLL05_10850 [Terriglobales bacterium]|nr:hypothetical protein [Terriglobales bacterium]